MPTITQLRKQRNLLMGKKKALLDKERLTKDKKKLMKEIDDLKNPRSRAFKQNLKRNLKIGGKAAGKGIKYGGKKVYDFLEWYTRPESKKKKKKRR